MPAPGSPFRLDIIHEKNFFISVLCELCFENYIGGILGAYHPTPRKDFIRYDKLL
jgi:hypothetical protein